MCECIKHDTAKSVDNHRYHCKKANRKKGNFYHQPYTQARGKVWAVTILFVLSRSAMTGSKRFLANLLVLLAGLFSFAKGQGGAGTASKCNIVVYQDYMAAEASGRSCFKRCDDYIQNPLKICDTKADCPPGSECKPRKLVLSRERHVYELEKCCKDNLDALKRERFGPPGRFEKRSASCDGMCASYDNLVFKGKRNAKCNCEETNTCYKSSMFWLCKILWECLGSNDLDYNEQYQPHWCASCGAAQAEPENFYDELDCGIGNVLATHSVCIFFVVAMFLRNLLA